MELPVAATEFIDKSLEYIYSFEPIAAKTVVLGKKMGAFLTQRPPRLNTQNFPSSSN